MGEREIASLAQRVAALMRDRLGARGQDLDVTLRQRGRQLPRRVRRAALTLSQASALDDHPRLRTQVDADATQRAAREVIGYLEPLGQAERRWRLVLSIAGSMAFALLATIAGVIGVLVWRGYL